MAVYRDEAAILRARDIGEADRIFGFFGLRRGRFSAVARSVRKLTSRKRGQLLTFSIVKVACAEGRSLDIVVDAENVFSIDPDTLDTESFERIGFAAFTIERFLPEGVREPHLYNLWKQYIAGERSERSTLAFVAEILSAQGMVKPEVYLDIRAGRGWTIRKLRRYVQAVLDSA